jgi:hypothetical protein
MAITLTEATRERLSAPRWVYGNVSHYSLTIGCPCCGTMYGESAQHIPCKPAECMLCGTVQCFSNGLGNGRCRLCSFGFLPGWSRPYDQRCGYAKCNAPAVAIVTGKKLACKDHAIRKCGDAIRAAIDLRDSGAGWQQWTWTGPRVTW